MTTQSIAERRHRLRARQSGLELAIRRQNEEIRALSARRHELVEQHHQAVEQELATYTDAELLDNPAQLIWLCGLDWHGPYQRYARLVDPDHPRVVVQNRDGREGVFEVLPRPTIMVRPHEPITEMTQAIKDWAAVWALGREDIPISVTNERYGATELRWTIATDLTALFLDGAGRPNPEDRVFAALSEAVGWIAEEGAGLWWPYG